MTGRDLAAIHNLKRQGGSWSSSEGQEGPVKSQLAAAAQATFLEVRGKRFERRQGSLGISDSLHATKLPPRSGPEGFKSPDVEVHCATAQR